MTPDSKQLAQLALEQYCLADAKLTLSQDLWNTTYCVTAVDGQKYNLRLCGADAQISELVEDELTFIDFIAKRNKIRVPTPARTLAGEFVTYVALNAEEPAAADQPQTRMCCLFEWIEGEVVRECLTDSVLQKMGLAEAHLHQAAREFRFPTSDEPFRKGYYYDETVILEHRDWIAERRDQIGPDRVALLNRAIDHLLDEFAQLPKSRETYGFIHADLNPNNCIVTNIGQEDEEVAVIDFEQLGRGHYAFDLATSMVEFEETRTDSARCWSNFKAGYQTVAELPFEDDRELAPFVMLVHMNFLDWLYNTPSPHVFAKYEERFHQVHELIRKGLA